MKKLAFLLLVLSTALLSGCVKTPKATESEMKEAASFALNVDASQVAISNIQQTGVKTNFIATVGKNTHRCYVTKAAAPKVYGIIPVGGTDTVSDAICTGGTTNPGSKTCDELSKRAGRCG